MEKPILQLLEKAGKFTQKEAALLQQELVHKKFVKDEFLLKVGEVCSSVYFLISGSFYQHLHDNYGCSCASHI